MRIAVHTNEGNANHTHARNSFYFASFASFRLRVKNNFALFALFAVEKELRVFPSCVKNNFALFAVEKRTSRLSVLAYLPLAPYLSRKRNVSGNTRNAPSAFSMRTTAVRRGDTTESDWWVWST